MSDLKYIVAIPFKKKAEKTLKEKEFIFILSIDLNWYSPIEAKKIIKMAEENKLLKRENDNLSIEFDFSEIQISPNFKPTKEIFKEKLILDRIIDRIALKTNLDKKEIISMIDKKNTQFSELINIDICALLVAIDYGVDITDFLDEEFDLIVK